MGFTTAEKSGISIRKKFLATMIAKCSSKHGGFLIEYSSITPEEEEEGTYGAVIF